MRPFNLAESKLAERNYCKKQIQRFTYITCFLAAVVVLIGVGSYAAKRNIQGEAAKVDSELASIEKRCNASRTDIDSAKLILSESKWRNQLAQKSMSNLAGLHAAIGCAPSNIWLSKVESKQDHSSLSIQGQATSFEALSVYTDRLRSLPIFSAVRISDSQLGTANNVTFLDFSITVTFKQANSEATAPATGGQPAGSTPGQVPVLKGA